MKNCYEDRVINNEFQIEITKYSVVISLKHESDPHKSCLVPLQLEHLAHLCSSITYYVGKLFNIIFGYTSFNVSLFNHSVNLVPSKPNLHCVRCLCMFLKLIWLHVCFGIDCFSYICLHCVQCVCMFLKLKLPACMFWNLLFFLCMFA